MCLKIDGQEFCDVLRQAPRHKGQSLERIEHNIEENKRPYSDEDAQMIASACGLDFEVCKDRIIRTRSRNAYLQIKRGDDGFHEYGPYFILPPECARYVRGEIHELPQVEHITTHAQLEIAANLQRYRFIRFCSRFEMGARNKYLCAYPEYQTWISMVEAMKAKRMSQMYWQYFTRCDKSEVPKGFLADAQLQSLLKWYARWFEQPGWQEPPVMLQMFMTGDEMRILKEHFVVRQELAARKPKHKQGNVRQACGWRDGWKKERRVVRNEFVAWKRQLKERCWPLIAHAVINGIPHNSQDLNQAA